MKGEGENDQSRYVLDGRQRRRPLRRLERAGLTPATNTVHPLQQDMGASRWGCRMGGGARESQELPPPCSGPPLGGHRGVCGFRAPDPRR